MIYELSIMTNDGWVVTLVSDREISIGDAVLHSIIVQPKSDYRERIAKADNNIVRHEVLLQRVPIEPA